MAVEIVLTKAVSQLPTLTFPGWDDFGQIARTLNELEHGMFRHASVMADQMRRDDRFSAVIRKRVDGLDAVPMLVKPADDSPKASAIAEDLGGLDDLPGKWGKRWPAQVLSDFRFWAIMMGICPGEFVWKTDDEETPPAGAVPGTKYKNGKRLRWTSRLIVWNPQWLRWDWSLFRYRLTTAQGEITLPDVTSDEHSDGKWILFAPFGYTEAWKKGLVRPSARLITRRQWTDRDWSRHNEKNGLAIDKAIVPVDAPKEAKDTFFDSVRDRNGETAVMCEQGFDANGKEQKFDLELVESTSKNWDTFEASKQDVNTDIAVLFLGQNTTTEIKEGKGSLGVAGHSDVERGILRKDAGMADCIYEQGLYWDTLHNYGDADLTPRPMWQVDPPEDQQMKADTINKMGLGLAAMKTAEAPIDDRAVLEQANLPTITPEEQAARQAVKAEQAAALARSRGPIGGAPGGDEEPDGDEDGGPPIKGKKGSAKMGASMIVKKQSFAGLPIAVESPKGSTRVWRESADGRVTGQVQMQFDYGFIDAGQMGGDDEELDCYLGPNEQAGNVHVVHQKLGPDYKKWDEDKVMLGFDTMGDAMAAYSAHHTQAARAFGGMSVVPLDDFKAKLKRRRGTGKIRASSSAAIAALTKLSDRAIMARAAAAKSKGPKELRYAQGLEKAALQLGVSSLAIDLASVKHEIEHASSFADLEQRLLRAYKAMDPRALASAVAKTRIMANLGGRLSVHKQVGSTRS